MPLVSLPVALRRLDKHYSQSTAPIGKTGMRKSSRMLGAGKYQWLRMGLSKVIGRNDRCTHEITSASVQPDATGILSVESWIAQITYRPPVSSLRDRPRERHEDAGYGGQSGDEDERGRLHCQTKWPWTCTWSNSHNTAGMVNAVHQTPPRSFEGDTKRGYAGHESEQLRVVASLEDLDVLERCMVDKWRSDMVLVPVLRIAPEYLQGFG